MYMIPIGWLYVAIMMSVAEATNSNGSILGAVITFVFYGLLPVSLVLYFMGAPGRKRAIKQREAAEMDEKASRQPDTSSHAPTDPVAPVREEP